MTLPGQAQANERSAPAEKAARDSYVLSGIRQSIESAIHWHDQPALVPSEMCMSDSAGYKPFRYSAGMSHLGRWLLSTILT